MDPKPLRYWGDFFADVSERFEREPGPAAARIIVIARRLDIGPAAIEPVGAVGFVALARFKLDIEFGAPFGLHFLHFLLGHNVLSHELLGIDLPGRRVIAN